MSAQTVRQLKTKVKKIGVDMWHTQKAHQAAMAHKWADYCNAKDELEKAKLKQEAIE
jgi:hypothetical protein